VTRTLPTALVTAVVLTWTTHAGAQALAPTDAPQQTATAPAVTAATSTPPATTATAADPAQPADQKPAEKPAEKPAAAAGEDRDDSVLNRSQPDFTLINLPTGLRMPKGKMAFRVTHRFTRPLGEGDFGDLAGDAFGLDSSAVIGLEFRAGLLPGLQVGVQRGSSDKTVQFFSQYDLKQQSTSFPVGLAAYAAIDGTNNFKDSYSPTLGLIVTREFGDNGAVYVEPIWVNNSNVEPKELVDHNDSFLLGLGTRIRVRPTTYFVLEVVPRVAGDDQGKHPVSFAVEKRVGGHAFQLVFSNTFGLTAAQLSRGGIASVDDKSNWYFGFNISRKFF
jgi:hypothetical protein